MNIFNTSDPQQLFDRAQENLEMLNEYREPTPVVGVSQDVNDGFVVKAFMTSVVIAVLMIGMLYIRYRLS